MGKLVDVLYTIRIEHNFLTFAHWLKECYLKPRLKKGMVLKL